jgi:hypothetical protein
MADNASHDATGDSGSLNTENTLDASRAASVSQRTSRRGQPEQDLTDPDVLRGVIESLRDSQRQAAEQQRAATDANSA